MPYALLILIVGVCGLESPAANSRNEPPAPETQIIFYGPEVMTVVCNTGSYRWYDSEAMVVPFRRNLRQGFIYYLKLASIPGHPGAELYSTLEVAVPVPRTQTFLERNAVPVTVTEEDIKEVFCGKAVTKVVYLPAPEFRELALPVETMVSYRLDAGADPIVESSRRGGIMAVLRIGPELRPTQACRSARFTGRLRCRFGRR